MPTWKSGEEIAKELHTSKQNIYQILKRGITKIYNNILEKGLAESPYEALYIMAIMFGINDQEQYDINMFYKSLPSKIKKEVYQDALIYKRG